MPWAPGLARPMAGQKGRGTGQGPRRDDNERARETRACAVYLYDFPLDANVYVLRKCLCTYTA